MTIDKLSFVYHPKTVNSFFRSVMKVNASLNTDLKISFEVLLKRTSSLVALPHFFF